MRIPIVVPEQAMPKKDPDGIQLCPCMTKPVKLNYKICTMTWRKELGDFVCKDEVVCEGEVEKKALEITSPCSGILVEKCIDDDDEFTLGITLGYIESEGNV